MRSLPEFLATLSSRTSKLRTGIILAIVSLAFLVTDVGISIRQQDPADYAANILQLRARRTAELADAIEAVTFQFISNQFLNDTLNSYILDSEPYDVSRWNTIFSEHMEGLAETVPELKDAVFFASNTDSKIPLTMSDSLTRSTWVPVKNLLMDEAMASDGRSVWSLLPETGGNTASERRNSVPRSTILCARLIKKRADRSPLGVLVLLIDPDRFARTVSGYSQDEGIAVTQKTDYSILLDRNGLILASVDSEFALKPLSKAIPGWETHLKGRLPLDNPGRYKSRATIDESKKPGLFWVVYSPIPEKDWLLLSILPMRVDAFPFIVKLFLLGGFAGSAFLIYRSIGKEQKELDSLATLDSAASQSGSQANHDLVLPSWFTDLSPKEQTVLLFLLTGKSNKEIAYVLELREQTVKNYLHAIYQRIGAQDRFSALLLLQDGGINLETLRRYMEKHPDFVVESRLFS
jgi:DNA-binding CsgD family transcriptional regulator